MNRCDIKTILVRIVIYLCFYTLCTTGRGQERPQLSEDDDEEVRGRDRSQQRRRGRKQQRKVNGGGEVEA